ncbi:MAG: ABC transporter permease [Actinobacteria bacterium HGW-Actinobacteria-7]|jgi:simple sugar transport system permease protein|nr:MAG: ABC transporter permease [Actinobacteria bacterium HGW-Actinobacteria-7]
MFSEVVTPELFASAVRLATPIALAAIGGAVCERSGVVNIAMEGLMLISAFAGVAAALLFGNAWIGVFVAVLASVLFSAIHAWASINLRADQVISGTAINILALGVTGFLMETIFGHPGTTDTVKTIKPLMDLPAGGGGVLGTIWQWVDVVFLSYTPLVYVGMFSAVFLTWAMYRTRWGLRLRALGEHPRAADTVGINVLRGRWVAVLISGFMAGLAGANLTLEQVGSFTENMTNGRGFIALAANIFGRWTPGGAYMASLLFGFADALQLKLQLFSDVIKIPPQFFLMLPYILTVIVLAGVVGRAVAPASVGKPYKEKG